MYNSMVSLQVLLALLFFATLIIIPVGLYEKIIKRDVRIVAPYIGFIITIALYFTIEMTVGKKINPETIVPSEYGVFVEYNGVSAYFDDRYLHKFHSDTTKIQYYYREDWHFLYKEKKYITYEPKDIQTR